MSTSVKIDGHAIRSLRESKDLTQLYLATVVGVTTDTISRWENKKYPAIKLENAQKLAEALEVDLEDILEKKTEDSPDAGPDKNVGSSPGPGSDSNEDTSQTGRKAGGNFKKQTIVAGVFFAIILAGIFFYFFFGVKSNPAIIRAERFLPMHTAPGLSFPVIIRLEAESSVEVPILIREEIDGNATAQNISKKKSSFDHTPRWIGRLRKGETAFLYMVFPGQTIEVGEMVRFSGDCVSGKVNKSQSKVQGKNDIELARYHWADKNRDYQISDNEILDAYETFTYSGDVEFDFSELEEFWLAGQYYWDEEKLRVYPGTKSQEN